MGELFIKSCQNNHVECIVLNFSVELLGVPFTYRNWWRFRNCRNCTQQRALVARMKWRSCINRYLFHQNGTSAVSSYSLDMDTESKKGTNKVQQQEYSTEIASKRTTAVLKLTPHEHHVVTDHPQLECLVNSLIRQTSHKTPKPELEEVLCEGDRPVTENLFLVQPLGCPLNWHLMSLWSGSSGNEPCGL